MQETITALRTQCIAEIRQCASTAQLQDVKVRYLGKSGQITAERKKKK